MSKLEEELETKQRTIDEMAASNADMRRVNSQLHNKIKTLQAHIQQAQQHSPQSAAKRTGTAADLQQEGNTKKQKVSKAGGMPASP